MGRIRLLTPFFTASLSGISLKFCFITAISIIALIVLTPNNIINPIPAEMPNVVPVTQSEINPPIKANGIVATAIMVSFRLLKLKYNRNKIRIKTAGTTIASCLVALSLLSNSPAHSILLAFGNLTYTGPLPSDKIEKLLFETVGLNPRQLQASDILLKRQEQVLKLIQTWDTSLEKEIVADNLYMDQSREQRIIHIKEIFEKAGSIIEVDKIEPWNQLRGTFRIDAENGIIEIYFALNPEKNPKIQDLQIVFEQNKTIK